MNHFDRAERGIGGTGLEKKRVGEIVGGQAHGLHPEKRGDGARRLAAVGMGFDESVVEVDIGIWDLVEGVGGKIDAAA